jgi:hypothetical protein
MNCNTLSLFHICMTGAVTNARMSLSVYCVFVREVVVVVGVSFMPDYSVHFARRKPHQYRRPRRRVEHSSHHEDKAGDACKARDVMPLYSLSWRIRHVSILIDWQRIGHHFRTKGKAAPDMDAIWAFFTTCVALHL